MSSSLPFRVSAAAAAAKRPKLAHSTASTLPPAPLPCDVEAPLLSLGTLFGAILLRRPSTTNKSPFMADCRLIATGEEVLVHTPSLELGGLCVPGARLLLSTAGAYSKKTAFAIQLLATEEAGETTWIGANPALGNRLVAAALARGLLAPILGAHTKLRAEVQPPGSSSRFDFLLEHGGGTSTTFLEAKSVTCADWARGTLTPNPQPKGYSHVFSAHRAGPDYQRAAIFPIGRKGQKLADGTTVVSERAIKHMRELAALCSPQRAAALCLVVNRADCHSLSLTRGSCPAFPAEVAAAAAAGVQVLAFRVRWSGETGEAFWEGLLPCDVATQPKLASAPELAAEAR